MKSPDEILSDSNRMRVINEILSAHTEDDWEFDRFTRLAAATLKVPICLVSLVTSDRQVFAGACGLPENLELIRETPLTHSVCQHAVTRRSMLVIEDTLLDPMVSGILSVKEYGVRSYLGCPLMTEDGNVLGSICAIDHVAREWTPDEADHIRDFAGLVVETIESRMAQNRSRSAFDVILHDLKSPLSGILMASSLLNEQICEVPERMRPLLESIGEEGGKALRLVETLAKENRDEVVVLCDDPRSVILTVVERLNPFAAAKSIRIETNLKDCVPLAVAPWVIEQVVENLVANSIKYSLPDGVVSVSARLSGKIGHFFIADEGPGFTEEDRKKIFKRYTRLSAMPTGNEPSTGLGLSIVKRLIDQHGGRIELMPGDGGAEFRISFSLAP